LNPGTDVPLGEESDDTVVEILDGSNNLLRTIEISDDGHPALLSGVVNPQYISGNNLLNPTAADTASNAYTVQTMRQGSWIEARLESIGGSFAGIGIIDPQQAFRYGNQVPAGTFLSQVSFSQGSPGFAGIRIAENGLIVYASGALGGVTAVRVRIVIGATKVFYYWDYTGNGSVPFFTSPNPAPTVVNGIVSVISGASMSATIQNILVGSLATPSVVYTSGEQLDDFGSLQNPVRVRISLVSAVVGRGDSRTADI
jgi:hypothetical protein